MGQTTPNMGIYIPAAGETNYDAAFAAGMANIDQHDHSGGPNKGVPISSSGIAAGAITYNLLNANVADNATGIGTNGSLGANQLAILGLLKNIYQLATTSGFISKDGSLAHARTIVANNDLFSVAAGDGVAGDPTFSLVNYEKYNTWTPTISGDVTPGTITYTVQNGVYSRIGYLAFVSFNVEWTGIGAAAGDIKIAGLPFPIKVGSPRPEGAVFTSGAVFDVGISGLVISGNSGFSTMDITQYGNGAGSGALDIWANGSITASMVYVIDF